MLPDSYDTQQDLDTLEQPCRTTLKPGLTSSVGSVIAVCDINILPAGYLCGSVLIDTPYTGHVEGFLHTGRN